MKEEPQSSKKLPVQQKVATPVRKEVTIEPMIPLESFYYGMYETGTENDSAAAVTFEANVSLLYTIPYTAYTITIAAELILQFIHFLSSVPNATNYLNQTPNL